jgi:hypothetical protein
LSNFIFFSFSQHPCNGGASIESLFRDAHHFVVTVR